MRTAACLFLSTVLAGLACAGNPVTAPAPVDKAALAVDDEPLPPEAPDPPGDRAGPRPRIRIQSASYGANCGRPKGNDTANLAKRCDGRRRCERRLLPKVTGWQVGQGRSLPCLPEYQVKWSCGDKPQRDLRSIASEEDVSRVRFGCGPEDPSRLRGAPVPRADAPATGVAKDTVRGRLVTSTGSPVVRATVTIGDSRATTDGDGGFLFHGVPASYDVHLGKTIAYLGLTRRDPVLVCCDGSEPGAWRYHAAITDAVITDIAPHQGHWAQRVVQFLAPKGSNEDRGSYEGQRVVGWRGDNVLTGTFVALIGYGPGDDPWVASYLATERWSLADGDAIAASPTLRKIGSGRIAGTAHLRGPIFPSPNEETLRFRYVVPGLAGSIDLGTCPAKGTYDCRLPDLSELGGEYCMVIGVGDEWSDARVSRCGGQLGMKDFSVPAAPPPPVVSHGAKVDADTMVAWSGKGRVFEIRMGPSWSPLIRIFTAKRSFAWSDFLTLGFTWSEFLRIGEGYGETSYSKPAIDVYTVSALEPYQSMDDLASGRGVMASGTSWQKVPSARSEHPSDKGFVALPPSVVSRLQAVKEPAMQPFDPSRLPACASTAGAMAIGDLQPGVFETRVTVRGTLTLTGDWGCTLKGCDCCNACHTQWMVADKRGSGMLIRRVGDRGPLGMGANECKLPKAPSIDVIATGLLIPGVNGRERARHRYLLDEASLCAVKPEAGRAALPLSGGGHQPVTPRIGRFEEGASQGE